jgi:ferredoxin-nitrite reductase
VLWRLTETLPHIACPVAHSASDFADCLLALRHPQKHQVFSTSGVVLPVGKMSCSQMRALAAIARGFGDGNIRLTVWQNLLISGIPEARLGDAKKALENAGLDWRASSIRAGLVAFTDSRGCRFSAADTKTHAEEIANWCEARVLDQPVNTHLTGCHHSCAQHYIGDIGLLAARVSANEEGFTVDGYHIVAVSRATQASSARRFSWSYRCRS